jgi:hypothetical protein
MPKRSFIPTTLLMAAAAGAIVTWAPIAAADDPLPPSDPNAQQQQPVNPMQFVDPALSAMQQLPSSGLPTGGLPTGYTPSGVGTGGTVLIDGVPTYIPPEGLSLPPGAVVGPPQAWIDSVKQSGCAPGCVPEQWRSLFSQGSDAASSIAGVATPPKQQPDDQQAQAGQ